MELPVKAERNGTAKLDNIVFPNAALLDDMNRLVRIPRLFLI